MPSVPVSLEEITLAWLNSLLQPAGWPEVRAIRLDRLPGANPKITQVFRAYLTFAGGDGTRPQSVIVKAPVAVPEHREHEAAHRVYEREIGVYELLRSQQGSGIPRLIAQAFDFTSGLGAILLEDLGVASPNQAVTSADMVDALAETLARLHAQSWESPALARTAWLRGPRNLDLWGDPASLYPPAWEKLSKWPEISDRLRRTGGELTSRLPAVLAELESRPRTLIHADLHPGNVMFRKGSLSPVIIDWQGAAFAGATSDLAKPLLHLPGAVLAKQERQLLSRYYRLLLAGGVAGYSFERFERDYRLAQAAIFANYAIIAPAARATGSGVFEDSLGRSFTLVSAAIEAVFPDDFAWP